MDDPSASTRSRRGRCVPLPASRTSRAFVARLALFALAALAIAPAPALARAPAPSEATLKTFRACVRSLKSTPYFRGRDDLDWRALEAQWRPRADAAEPGEELRQVLNAMVMELDASHAAVLDGTIYRSMMNELAGRPSPTFGALLEEMEPGRLFVRALYEKGPAERAGLRLGDELVAVEGEPPLESAFVVDAGYDPGEGKTRLFTLVADAEGSVLDVAFRSRAGAKVARREITAEATSGLEAGRRSVRVVEVDGRRIGIVHLWMVARGSADLLSSTLKKEFAGCDGVVVDLRGRGGFSDEIDGLLAPFRAKSWRKPVVFLTDDRTRSAKEIVAWHVRDERLGTLVGEPTEGAVLGAGFFPLPGGLYLEAPMMEVPVGDGSSLEGVGVRPHVTVRRAGPYAAGVDPILARGIALLTEKLSGTARRRGPY